MADAIPRSRPQLGLMTASNRDNWSEARDKLLELGGTEMEAALETLESGAIVVNLDEEAPVSRQECGETFLSGGLKSGENRWFDKSLQIIVVNNGKSAFLGEHSMSDGMPMVNYANWITKQTYGDIKKQSANSGSSSPPNVVDIFGDVLSKIEQTTVSSLEKKGKAVLFGETNTDRRESLTQTGFLLLVNSVG